MNIKTAADAFPNNGNADGTGAVNVTLNEKIGGQSAISQIQITNASNMVLESINNYGKLLSSQLGKTTSFDSYATTVNSTLGAASSNLDATGLACNNTFPVSCKLMCGLFLEGLDLPMGGPNFGTGGLILSITLNPSVQALYGVDSLNSYFEILNPKTTPK